MGKDRQISHAVGFQIIYVDTLPWERWGVTPALPAAAQRGFLHTVGLFQRVNSLERGETSHVTEEEPDKHDLSQGSRSISAEVSHADTSNMICESGSLTPWFSSPRFIIQSNHKKKKKKKKKPQRHPYRRTFYRITDQYSSKLSSKTLRNHPAKRSPRRPNWSAVTGMGSCDRRPLGKSKETWIKYVRWVIIMDLCWFIITNESY